MKLLMYKVKDLLMVDTKLRQPFEKIKERCALTEYCPDCFLCKYHTYLRVIIVNIEQINANLTFGNYESHKIINY